MGIEHYLVNKKTKKLYLLGKGTWFDLFGSNPSGPDLPKAAFWNLLSLRHELGIITSHWNFEGDISRDDYLSELARQLREFVGDAVQQDLELLYEETEPYDRLGWPVVGT